MQSFIRFATPSALSPIASVDTAPLESPSTTTGAVRYRHEPYSWTASRTHVTSPGSRPVKVLSLCLDSPQSCALDRAHSSNSCGFSDIGEAASESTTGTPPQTYLSTPTVAVDSATSSRRSSASSTTSLPRKPVVASAAAGGANSSSTLTRYAEVQFKFYTSHFVAPFRVAAGDVVVARDDFNNQLIGVVRGITTIPPRPFVAPMPSTAVLVRHAREVDRVAKAELMPLETSAMDYVHYALSRSPTAAVAAVCELEWNLDGAHATVLVSSAVHDACFVEQLRSEVLAHLRSLRGHLSVKSVGIVLQEY